MVFYTAVHPNCNTTILRLWILLFMSTKYVVVGKKICRLVYCSNNKVVQLVETYFFLGLNLLSLSILFFISVINSYVTLCRFSFYIQTFITKMNWERKKKNRRQHFLLIIKVHFCQRFIFHFSASAAFRRPYQFTFTA